jgi:hypothetical protein
MEISNIAAELESLATTGTRVPGFRKRVLVDIDRLVELGNELRNSVPVSIREAEEVIKQKESILSQTNMEAQRIKESATNEAMVLTNAAKREHEAKVDQSEVIKSADERAEKIKEDAVKEGQRILQDTKKKAYLVMERAESAANVRKQGADQYSKEVLFSLEDQVAGLLSQVRKGIDVLKIEAQAVPKELNQKTEEKEPVQQLESEPIDAEKPVSVV